MAYIDKFGVEYSDDKKTLVRCPQDLKGEYIVLDGVTNIQNAAFKGGCLNAIVLPETLNKIGKEAFADCKRLSQITVPKNVSVIQEETFRDCEYLVDVTLPNNLKEIKSYAFAGCVNLREWIVPESVERIGERAFRGCALSKIFIKSGISSSAFNGCPVADIYLHENIEDFSYGPLDPNANSVIPTEQPNFLRIHLPSDSSILYGSWLNNVDDLEKLYNKEGESITRGYDTNCGAIECSFVSRYDNVWDHICIFAHYIVIKHSIAKIYRFNKAYFDGDRFWNVWDERSRRNCYEEDSISYLKVSLKWELDNVDDDCFDPVYEREIKVIPQAARSFQLNLGIDDCATIIVPDSVANLQKGTITGGTEIYLSLPDSIQSIDEEAIEDVDSIYRITVPKGQKARFVKMFGKNGKVLRPIIDTK